MKNLCSLAFLLLPFFASGQSFTDAYFQIPSTDTCWSDSNLTVAGLVHWEVYQTTNDLWDGPRDSVCIAYDGDLQINQAQHGKPVFFRHKFDDSNKILLTSNGLYKISTTIWPTMFTLDTGTNCGNGLCSGMMVGIEIPDELGTGTDMRWHTGTMDLFNQCDYNMAVCFPTEKFSENYLREFVLKFLPDTFGITDAIDVGGIVLSDESWNFQPIDSASMGSFLTSQFDFSLYWVWVQTYMAMYTDTTYPSAGNTSYIDLVPSPNVDTVATVTLTIENQTSLIYQPHVQFRGSEILNDTLRHNLNIINYGELCIAGWIDVLIGQQTNFTFQSGSVSFGGPGSCMQFYDGGTLTVPDGVTFHYGQEGTGMLALLPNGHIGIGQGSELIVSNRMVVCQKNNSPDFEIIEMDLQPGSKLTFAPGANLHSPCDDGETKLHINMLGGHLDLSGLPTEDLKNLRLVYPEGRTPAGWSNALHVWPNPVSDRLIFDLESPIDAKAEVSIYDLDGRLMQVINANLIAGENFGEVNVAELAAGAYSIVLRTDSQLLNARFVKM